MGIKFTNNAEGTLTAGVGSGDTTNMTLTAGDGLLFPTIVLASGNYFYATLVDQSGNREIVNITEHQEGTDVFQTFVRAQDDTDAIAFQIGDKVQIRFPKIVLEEFRDDIAANLAAIESNDSDITAIEAKSTADEQVLYGPSGLTMYIYNAAGEIPTGWSAHSGPADCLLAVAGGSNAYNVAGENLAGSWTPTGHVHTGPSHVHTMNTHVHSGPSHTHTGPNHTHSGPNHNHIWSNRGLYTYNSGGSQVGYTLANVAAIGLTTRVTSGDGWYNNGQYLYTNNSGTGQTGAAGTGATGASGTANTGATDPGDTNASGTANSGSSKEPSTDRPYAAVGLLIERD
jgi:hypothetical protein